MFNIIPYQPQHREVCIEIFRSNIPNFFLENEVALFTDYLDQQAQENYWVLKQDERIVACGGYAIETSGVARLVWGIVHSSEHKKGFGRMMVEHRLQELKKRKDVFVVQMDTTQHNPEFFAKFGFEVRMVTPNKYGPGLDSYELELVLEEYNSK